MTWYSRQCDELDLQNCMEHETNVTVLLALTIVNTQKIFDYHELESAIQHNEKVPNAMQSQKSESYCHQYILITMRCCIQNSYNNPTLQRREQLGMYAYRLSQISFKLKYFFLFLVILHRVNIIMIYLSFDIIFFLLAFFAPLIT